MRLAVTLALALCVALPAPITANASDGVTPVHQHRIHTRQVVRESFNPAATVLTPPFAIVPAAAAAKSDDGHDGLSRDRDKCNYGCIDNGN
jgi:hypothetical protein